MNDTAGRYPFAQQTDTRYAELETQLLEAVADFGVEELNQMLDAAKALRRVRRL
jgi:hypothetical protein